MGRVDYEYDVLGRLVAETRYFNELGQSYRLTYQYDLAGELTQETNPWGAVVGYTRDQAGQVTAITGAGYAGVTVYAQGIRYRAFWAVKQVVGSMSGPLWWVGRGYKYDYYDPTGGGGGAAPVPVPQNPEPQRQQRLSQEECDRRIAAIFGGPGAVAATATEPSTLQHPSAGRDRSAHLANSGTFHLYTNAQGTDAAVGLYAPPGWVGRPASGTVYQGANDPNPGAVTYNYVRFNYRGGLSIFFVHVSNQGINRHKLQ
jgi:YD repeat-containing protein